MSEKAKHTPGPFTTDAVFGDHEHDIVLDYDVPGGGSPIVVGTVFYDEDNRRGPGDFTAEEAAANARLFAASPELLAACHAWSNYFAKLEAESDPEDRLAQLRDHFHAERVKVTRAAIAKATGATPR